jgi:hypothetical protein
LLGRNQQVKPVLRTPLTAGRALTPALPVMMMKKPSQYSKPGTAYRRTRAVHSDMHNYSVNLATERVELTPRACGAARKDRLLLASGPTTKHRSPHRTVCASAVTMQTSVSVGTLVHMILTRSLVQIAMSVMRPEILYYKPPRNQTFASIAISYSAARR